MFPYIFIFPLWLVLAFMFPAVQSLHALKEKSDERRVWIFYWMSFAAAAWALYFFGWLVRLPFSILALYVDIYYEVQLGVVFWLVFPKTFGIKIVQTQLESNGDKIMSVVKAKGTEAALKAREKIMELR